MLISYFYIILTLLIISPPLALAGNSIAVEDHWDQKGLLIVEGEKIRLKFVRDGEGVWLYKSGLNAEQCIKIIPFAGRNNYGNKLVGIELKGVDESSAEVEATFLTTAKNEMKGRFYLDDSGVLALTPVRGMEGVRLEGDIKFGVLPGIVLEDIIYDPGEAGGVSQKQVPSEGVFLGLLGKGDGMMVCAWPEGNQKAIILLEEKTEEPVIDGLEIKLDHMNIYIGLSVREGIWHPAEFSDDYHDQNIQSGWRQPFSARWRTELPAGGEKIRTAFIIRNEADSWWYEVVGNVERGPVWFDDKGEAFFYLKSGQFSLRNNRAFIYPFERHSLSLMEVLKSTPLAGQFAEARSRSNPHRPPHGIASVGFEACRGTTLLRKTMLASGVYRAQRFMIDWMEHTVDVATGVQNRRRAFTEIFQKLLAMTSDLTTENRCAHTVAFLTEMYEIIKLHAKALADQPSAEEYINEVHDLTARFENIISVPGTEFITEYDNIVARLNSIAYGQRHGISVWGWRLRKIFQQAGELCKNNPEAVPYAEEIRREIRQFLRQRSWDTFPGL